MTDLTRLTEGAINGLKGSPILLFVFLVNIIGIGGAVWFLSRLAAAQDQRWNALLRACLPHGSP